MRDPELLTTADAGATWTMHAIPIPDDVQQLPAYGSLPAETTYWPGIVDAVSCSSPGVCDVVGHVETNGTGLLVPDAIVFLSTTDGGVHWTSTTLPERSSESDDEVQAINGSAEGLACPTTSTCVVVATLAGFNLNAGTADAWITTDGGATWSVTEIANTSSMFAHISCSDVHDCWAGPSLGTASVPSGVALHSVDGGATWTAVPLPAIPAAGQYPVGSWQSISCTSADVCFVGGDGIVETTDGGSTWTHAPMPAGIGEVLGISCQADATCVAVATPATGSLGVSGEGSLILTDGPTPGSS